jgi:hypothetical protein
MNNKRIRFVQPEIVRLDLSDGDWVDVKKRLTVGEERAAFQAIVGEVNSTTGWRRPNVEMVGVAEMVAYIVRWSFRDANDLPVAVTVDAIKQMDSESFAEIEKALEKHIAAVEAELTAAKNVQGGKTATAATSPSAA